MEAMIPQIWATLDETQPELTGSEQEQHAEPETPEAEVTTEKLIDSRTFGPAADVSIDNIVTIKKGEKPSFRELAEQNLDEVSTKVFNVPGKKIRGRATLTDGEAKSLQRLFFWKLCLYIYYFVFCTSSKCHKHV